MPTKHEPEFSGVVACCGSFDGTIHPGHMYFLNTARQYGNLYVFVVIDDTIRNNKQREPLFDQTQRVKHLEALQLAARVIPLKGTDDEQLQQIVMLMPTTYCFGGDQFYPFDKRLAGQLRERGSTIVRIPLVEPEKHSTTKLHFPTRRGIAPPSY